MADLSAENLQARREWQNIFKVPKEKNLQPCLLYLAKIFKIDKEIRGFMDLCGLDKLRIRIAELQYRLILNMVK